MPMSKKLDSFCTAYGNPERVRLVHCLAREMTVSELLNKCSLSQSALSQHLAVLRSAGIVAVRKEGRHVYYRTAAREYQILARRIIRLMST